VYRQLGDRDDGGSLFGKLGNGNNGDESIWWNSVSNNWKFLKYYNSSGYGSKYNIRRDWGWCNIYNI